MSPTSWPSRSSSQYSHSPNTHQNCSSPLQSYSNNLQSTQYSQNQGSSKGHSNPCKEEGNPYQCSIQQQQKTLHIYDEISPSRLGITYTNQKPRNPRRNANNIIHSNNREHANIKPHSNSHEDNFRIMKTVSQYNGNELNQGKSELCETQSCIASILNAPILPYPRSSEIYGIEIKKSINTRRHLPRRVNMSGLKTREVPILRKLEDTLPSVETLFGLDKFETLSMKLGPRYRKPDIKNNPAFRTMRDKQILNGMDYNVCRQ